MKERPILFSAPMVRAILDGRKTQTRRPVKPAPFPSTDKVVFERHPFAPSALKGTPAEGMKIGPERDVWQMEDWCGNIIGVLGTCPFGAPGDLLWVRETFVYRHKHDRYYYRADHPRFDPYAHDGWKPSIHMPRRASRITLEVTGVRVERLSAISEADAIAEGADSITASRALWKGSASRIGCVRAGYPDAPANTGDWTPRDCFRLIWGSINGASSWAKNPWVWVVNFRRLLP